MQTEFAELRVRGRDRGLSHMSWWNCQAHAPSITHTIARLNINAFSRSALHSAPERMAEIY